MIGKCEDCAFFEYGAPGECHRHAPTVTVFAALNRNEDEPGMMSVAWPSTYEFDWCGEFHPTQSEATA